MRLPIMKLRMSLHWIAAARALFARATAFDCQ